MTDPLRFGTRLLPRPEPISLRTAEGVLWVRKGEGLSGWGEVARLDCGTGPGRFARAEALFNEAVAASQVDDEADLPGSGPVAFASFTFDENERGSVVLVPAVVTGRRGGIGWQTVTGDNPAPMPAMTAVDFGRVRYAGASLSEVQWLDAVARAERATRVDGALDKVVLARDLIVWAERDVDPRLVAERLAERFPECFTFYCSGLIGATPELLVRRMGTRVESLVLAGSARRGADPDEDQSIERALLDSDKDVAEHDLAVNSIVTRLQSVCDAIQSDGPRVLKLANVQHLSTRVEGTLNDLQSSLALAALLHPSAAVGGVPRADALDLIRDLEGMARGRYAGPVGWMDSRGDGEWGIALRCAELDGRRARLFAGAGIVAGSLPEAELEETRLKLRAMQSVLGPHEERYADAR